jgi:hypothetical protein
VSEHAGARPADLPDLRSLRAPRHPGVSDALCESLREAAEVCLARHHAPPRISFRVSCNGTECARNLTWREPGHTAELSWKNQDDATRDGAYSIAIAVVEAELDMVALSRADTRSGADWYIGTAGASDLENAYRLEVSGLDSGNQAEMRRRLRLKESQAARGESFLPAYASVVGFREATALLSSIEQPRNE